MNDSPKAGIRVYEGAVAIVTGGASGIGRAFASELAANGAEVVIADLDSELGAITATEIRERGGKATFVVLDVCDHAAMSALVTEMVARHGRLDFIFNTVGIIFSGTALDHGIDDWNRVLDVNIRGVVNGIEAAYPIMVEQGFGHIVNMSSVAGLVPFYNVPYTTSRFAIVGMSLTLRGEASLHGVRVTLLCPGAIRTDTFSDSGKFGKRLVDVPEEVRRAMLDRLRPIDPDRYVRLAMRGIARNRAMIVAPWRARSIWRSFRRTPLLTNHLIFKYVMKPLLLKAERRSTDSMFQGEAGARSEGSAT